MPGVNVAKQEIADLAVLGGAALFENPIIVGRPYIPDASGVVDDIRDILASGTLSNNGPYVQKFEEEVCRISGVAHCVATCNATAALEVTARALGLTGEVIVPSFTFIATAHALAWQGLTPVFVDVDPVTHTIDPDSVEAAITASTSSICAVHLWGNACDVSSLQSIADRHGLSLWFDSSHALYVNSKGIQIGNFGKAEVFSFHATKFINAFEGGAIVTNDTKLAQKLRQIRSFGFAENGEVAHVGINAKMSEASAAMGLRSLNHIDQIRDVNRRNSLHYSRCLAACRGIRMRAPTEPEKSNCQYVVCEVDESRTGISRDLLLQVLEMEGILAKRYFHPGCHKASPYREGHLMRKTPLPVTERLAETLLVLPTGANVSLEDIECVCTLIRFVVDSSKAIQNEIKRARL